MQLPKVHKMHTIPQKGPFETRSPENFEQDKQHPHNHVHVYRDLTRRQGVPAGYFAGQRGERSPSGRSGGYGGAMRA